MDSVLAWLGLTRTIHIKTCFLFARDFLGVMSSFARRDKKTRKVIHYLEVKQCNRLQLDEIGSVAKEWRN